MIYLKLMRVKHYIKNLLIFFPLGFSGNFFDLNYLFITIVTFVSFSLVSSIVYIFNDILDVEKDRLHIKKKHRPLASGEVSLRSARMLQVLLVSMLIIINTVFFINFFVVLIYLIYFTLNLLYSVKLKNVPIIELFIVSSGFLFRVLVGGLAINVAISSWLFLTVLAMSLYLAIGKRRNELMKLGESSREVLKKYSLNYLDKFMYLFLATTIIFYSLWTVFVEARVNNDILVWTVPLVILIVMKYSFIVEGDDIGDPADVLFSDKLLLSLVFIYGVMIFGIFYGRTFLNLL